MFAVILISDAENDIFDIYQYVANHDSPIKARNLFDNLKTTILSLDHQPTRGHFPPELERIDVRDFLEIHYGSYRIIYQIIDKNVFVHAVMNGCRDLSKILQRRLLRTN